jgi:hypothetical protein
MTMTEVLRMGDRELSDLYYEMVSGECETPEETAMDDE